MLATLACSLLATRPASADTKDEAEKQFRAGVTLQKGEDFEGAIAAFEASLALYPTKSALFNLANCLRATHRYPESLKAFERLQRDFGGELDEPMLSTVAAQLVELNNLTGSLQLQVDQPGAELSVDGKSVGRSPLPAPLRLGLGDHEIQVSLEGFETQTLNVNLAPAERATRTIDLTPAAGHAAPSVPPAPAPTPPAPAPAPPPRHVVEEDAAGPRSLGLAGTLSAGAGGLLLAGGSVTGLWALSVDRDLKSACEAGHCPSSRQSDIDKLDRLTLATNLLLATGAVAAVSGVVLWLVDDEAAREPPSQSRLEFGVASGFVGCSLSQRF